jgi:hypothetical protein
MRIDGAGATPWLPNPTGARPAGPPPPASGPAVTATSAANQAQQSVMAQALQQAEQQKGGGGGGGHGHSKTNLKAIEDVAARATLNIETREKTPAERFAEIERMKALQKAAGERVGEKRDGDPDADEGKQRKQGQQPDDRDEEQPAEL